MSKVSVELVPDGADKTANAVGGIDQKLKDMGRSAQAVAKETERGANLATGSYAKLRAELASNKKALETLEVGSDAFKEQAAEVAKLEEQMRDAKTAMAEAVKVGQKFDDVAVAVSAADNSIEKLEKNLKQATAELKRLERGTPAYEKQAKVVGKLSDELDEANKELKGFTNQKVKVEAVAGSLQHLESELSDNVAKLRQLKFGTAEFDKQKTKVDRLTHSLGRAKSQLASGNLVTADSSRVVGRFISEVGAVAGGIASVGAIVSSLKTDIENLRRIRENERLANVDAGAAAALALPNIPEPERIDLEPLAVELSDELGLRTGGIIETLGTLRTSGAENLKEAGRFLLEAAKAIPQDLAQQTELAKAALINARATGNRDPKQAIGGLLQAQAASQVTSAEEFAKAFSSNISAAVQNLGFKPERAREEAAIFSILETKSAEVAATAQQSFFTQVQKFVPSLEAKLANGTELMVSDAERQKFLKASVPERIELLEAGGDLQKQFESKLQDTGRNAIVRRLRKSDEDKAAFGTIRERITDGAGAAKEFSRLQEQAQRKAAFAIAAGRREVQAENLQLRKDGRGAIAAEAEATLQNLQDERNNFFGGSVKSAAEDFGFYVEKFGESARATLTGEPSRDDAQLLLDTIRFESQNPNATQQARDYAQQQLERLDQLVNAVEQQNRLLERPPANRPQVQEVRLQNAGPVEAPPAAAQVP